MRLGGCNLTCRWCDTPYTWDWKGTSDTGIAYRPSDELHTLSTAAVIARLLEFGTGMVVVSGGEPLSQQLRLLPVVRELRRRGIDVEIETNGTLAPAPDLLAAGVRFNVSPKLGNSGVSEHRRIVPDSLRALAQVPGTAFKFVCGEVSDLAEVDALVERFALRNIWIMPRGQHPEEIAEGLRTLTDAVIARKWNISGRLHVTLWGSKRGV